LALQLLQHAWACKSLCTWAHCMHTYTRTLIYALLKILLKYVCVYTCVCRIRYSKATMATCTMYHICIVL
jgi:hypothetical protein